MTHNPNHTVTPVLSAEKGIACLSASSVKKLQVLKPDTLSLSLKHTCTHKEPVGSFTYSSTKCSLYIERKRELATQITIPKQFVWFLLQTDERLSTSISLVKSPI